MASQDDQLEEWIIRDDMKQERRARIVRPSSERLVAENPGDGEAAVVAVASWIGAQKRLPIVELATLSQRALTLTFSEHVELPYPWVSQAGPADEPHDQWGITLQHAMSLPKGDEYGWQVAGLTGMGTLADGSRGLINTSRWGILGLAGSPEWTRRLMITQVMNQAAEPWSKGQDIWLVGYGEIAEKLTSFLAPYHPPHRMHTADSFEQITSADLREANATIYIMGANADTEKHYNALGLSNFGIVTDQIISDQCMFLSERTAGGAVLGPFSTNLEIYPNSSPELIEVMESAWQANEQLIAEKSATADFTDFHKDSGSPLPATEKSDDEIKADFEDLITGLETPEAEDPAPTETTDLEESLLPLSGQVLEDDSESQQSQKPLDLVMKSAEADNSDSTSGNALDEDSREDGIEDETSTPSDTSDAITARNIPSTHNGTITSDAISAPATGVHLTLLGSIQAHGPAEEIKGRHAAALVLLHLSSGPLTPQQISDALWPDEDNAGHTARTRRSRLLAKIREGAGEAVTIDADNWQLDRNLISTDYDQVISVLTKAPIEQQEPIIKACAQIETPMEGAGAWAAEYRSQMQINLHRILADLKDRAIDADAFATAKAAKAAASKLGDS